MQTSLREDILEAILCLAGEGGGPIPVKEIAAQIRAEPRNLDPVLAEMARGGEVTLEGGTASLTGPGLERARGVAHRHQVLQCFLSERLGIDGTSADREACRLEHQVSDETIDRLTEMMGEEAVAGARGARPLPEFGEGDEVRVQLVRGSSALDRLLDLGILPGEAVEVRRTLPNGAVVLVVKGCDIALSPEIAGSILAVKRR
ncbi:MAG: metal-dependent transcriptional regulator [Methanomicrobiales archaeon]|nr:metal-dependent transcriptional regulator [Methanomicrobiales archaeon]